MKTEQKQQIATALKTQLEQTGKSYQAMAETIGAISAPLINNIVNNNWIKDGVSTQLDPSDKMWNKVAMFLGLHNQWIVDDTYTNFKRVQMIAHHAKTTHVAHGIISTPGLGKSGTLKHISKVTKNVFYLECDEHWSKKVFINKLKQAMGMPIEAQGISDMFDDVINALSKLESPLIIIDEADMLKDGVLSVFVSLYNKTLNRCGFVVSGSMHLKQRIEKGVRLNRQAYNNIYSRIGKEFKPLYPLTEENIKSICIINNVDESDLIKRVVNTANNDLRRVKAEIDKIKLEQQKQSKN
jgi:DNA transposition AAA+ family ATPase